MNEITQLQFNMMTNKSILLKTPVEKIIEEFSNPDTQTFKSNNLIQ